MRVLEHSRIECLPPALIDRVFRPPYGYGNCTCQNQHDLSANDGKWRFRSVTKGSASPFLNSNAYGLLPFSSYRVCELNVMEVKWTTIWRVSQENRGWVGSQRFELLYVLLFSKNNRGSVKVEKAQTQFFHWLWMASLLVYCEVRLFAWWIVLLVVAAFCSTVSSRSAKLFILMDRGWYEKWT